MAEAFGIQEKSLKKMAAIVLGLRISKSQQTSNWGAVNYTAEQKLYAATDAWICREIYLEMLNHNSEISPVSAAAFVDMAKPKPKRQPQRQARRWAMRRRAQREQKRAAAGSPPIIILNS
jgi:ribonuclease D